MTSTESLTDMPGEVEASRNAEHVGQAGVPLRPLRNDLGNAARDHHRPRVMMMEGTFSRAMKNALIAPMPMAQSSASATATP